MMRYVIVINYVLAYNQFNCEIGLKYFVFEI
jgi:hypothetical protein